MLTPLKKGDPVRVRLASGEVVVAEYSHIGSDGPHHFVMVGGEKYVTVGLSDHMQLKIIYETCRFVGPPAVCAPMGVSND